jgi:hypothetical protein
VEPTTVVPLLVVEEAVEGLLEVDVEPSFVDDEYVLVVVLIEVVVGLLLVEVVELLIEVELVVVVVEEEAIVLVVLLAVVVEGVLVEDGDSKLSSVVDISLVIEGIVVVLELLVDEEVLVGVVCLVLVPEEEVEETCVVLVLEILYAFLEVTYVVSLALVELPPPFCVVITGTIIQGLTVVGVVSAPGLL